VPASSVAPVQVALELGGSLRELVGDPRVVPLERELAASLCDLMGGLGIDGRVGVATFAAPDDRALRVRVEGREVPYRPALLWQAWLALAGRLDAPLPPARPGATSPDAFVHTWMAREDGQPRAPHRFGIVDYLCTLATAIVSRRPACLLPAVPSGWKESSGELLRTLLDLGVSIEDRSCIESGAAIGAQLGLPWRDVAEAVFAELRPYRVEVCTPDGVLEGSLLYGSEASDENLHATAQPFLETLYGGYGVWAPPVTHGRAIHVSGNVMTIRLNDRISLPTPLLPADALLIPSPASELAGISTEAVPAVNPLTGEPAALVPAADRDRLEGDPVEPWEAFGFALYRTLVDDAGSLICLRHVERSLMLVGRMFDDLTQCALERLSLYELTRVLRGLVRDGLSIRNMRAILDRLVRYQPQVVSPNDVHVLTPGVAIPSGDYRLDEAPRAEELLAYARLGQPDEIISRTAISTPIPVAVLDPILDERLVDAAIQPLEPAEEQFIRDHALAAAEGGVHAIVSSVAARAELRALVGPASDDLPIVADAELAHVDLDARVTLPAPAG
jgi:FHIPEP family